MYCTVDPYDPFWPESCSTIPFFHPKEEAEGERQCHQQPPLTSAPLLACALTEPWPPSTRSNRTLSSETTASTATTASATTTEDERSLTGTTPVDPPSIFFSEAQDAKEHPPREHTGATNPATQVSIGSPTLRPVQPTSPLPCHETHLETSKKRKEPRTLDDQITPSVAFVAAGGNSYTIVCHNQQEPLPTITVDHPKRKRRRRAKVACTYCRARKQKCDDQWPCHRCVRDNNRDGCRREGATPSTNDDKDDDKASSNSDRATDARNLLLQQQQILAALRNLHVPSVGTAVPPSGAMVFFLPSHSPPAPVANPAASSSANATANQG